MEFKKYNVVVARPYHDDPEKKAWKNVGSLLYFPPTAEKPEPGFILELNMYPTTDFKIFAATEKKAETGTGGGGSATTEAPKQGGGSVEKNGDIPF